MIEITEKDLQEVPLEDEYTAMLETQGEEATKVFYICNAFKYLHRRSIWRLMETKATGGKR